MEKIIKSDVAKQMEEDFLVYAPEYVENRAVPRLEDGFKPIHRRILYTMFNINHITGNHLKSTKIVGDVMGSYHPHGDASIYDAYIVMSQSWNNPYPLVEIHGNNGSIDNDPPASSRYTEGKVTKYGIELASTLNKIDDNNLWQSTELENGLEEPVNFPTLLPNLLINGSNGISLKKVDIPPFNFKEVCDLCIKIAENKNIDKTILYPDFGNANGNFKNPSYVYAQKEQWIDLNKNGDATFYIYGNIQNDPSGLTITSIPWNTNGNQIVDDIVALTDPSNKRYIDDIMDLDRLSSKTNGFLLKIKLKKNADREHIKQLLYSYTHLKTTYHAIFNLINEGRIQKLGVIDICKQYVANSKKYITQMYQKLIKDEQAELNIILGLIKLHTMLDKVIKLVKASKNRDEVVNGLIKLGFNEPQAQYIANLMLHKLSKDQTEAWQKRKIELEKLIKEQTAIINSDKLLTADYIKRMQDYIKEFARPRFTEVLDHDLAIDNINTKEGQKQLALLKKNADNDIYFDKEGNISYNQIKTKWKFPDDKDLIVISNSLMYYNYLAHNNINDLKTIFKEPKLKILEVLKYDENKDILIVTTNKIKRIALKDLKDRIKPDELISASKKCLGLFLLDKDDKRIIVGKGKDGSLGFKVSEVPYQVKGSGVAFAKQDIEKCELVKRFKDVRKRSYTLK